MLFLGAVGLSAGQEVCFHGNPCAVILRVSVCVRWVNAVFSNVSGPLDMAINGVHLLRDVSHHRHVVNVHSCENSSTPTVEIGVLSLQIYINSPRKQIPSLTRKGETVPQRHKCVFSNPCYSVSVHGSLLSR